jgi:hypothetical protein
MLKPPKQLRLDELRQSLPSLNRQPEPCHPKLVPQYNMARCHLFPVLMLLGNFPQGVPFYGLYAVKG